MGYVEAGCREVPGGACGTMVTKLPSLLRRTCSLKPSFLEMGLVISSTWPSTLRWAFFNSLLIFFTLGILMVKLSSCFCAQRPRTVSPTASVASRQEGHRGPMEVWWVGSHVHGSVARGTGAGAELGCTVAWRASSSSSCSSRRRLWRRVAAVAAEGYATATASHASEPQSVVVPLAGRGWHVLDVHTGCMS
jgi:hypothetical protein